MKYNWILDPGHGPLTKGKRSPKLKDGRQLFEYEFNRDIAHRLGLLLDSAGIKHTLSLDPKANIGDYLVERVQRANDLPNDPQRIFLSIHSNAGPALPNTWSIAHGVEVWFFAGSKIGEKMAKIFEHEIVKATGFGSRGPKSQPTKQFYVLRKTEMLAILTENGFYNNLNQVEELFKDDVRQKIAEAHFAAIKYVEEKGIYYL
jgi:N-acetylmuramoyl-L-alanine amidase